MKDDLVVQEVRRIRDQYAKQFGYSAEKIVADLTLKAKDHKSRMVSFAPRSTRVKNYSL
jgi:hypothetical protein